MKNRYIISIVSTLIFNFFFSGDVSAHGVKFLNIAKFASLKKENSTNQNSSDTVKPALKTTQTNLTKDTFTLKKPFKILWRDYLNDTLWDEQNRTNLEFDHDQHDGCHNTSTWKISYNIILNKPLDDNRLTIDTFHNRDTLLRRINSLSGQDYAWRRFTFWYGDTGRKFNPLKRQITPHSYFYFISAHPLNSNQWLLQSQNFLGFRAQYGITNYLSAGVSRDYSGFWWMSNTTFSPVQYRGYALSLSVHGGDYFPLNSKFWGSSINQSFVSKNTKTSLRISTYELIEIKDSRKHNLAYNVSHIQRINSTWSVLAELAYFPGNTRKSMATNNKWINAEQLKAPRGMDQYSYLIGLRKVMGRKTQFDFGIQTISLLGEIYTELPLPKYSFVEKWTIVLPFPFINMSIVL